MVDFCFLDDVAFFSGTKSSERDEMGQNFHFLRRMQMKMLHYCNGFQENYTLFI